VLSTYERRRTSPAPYLLTGIVVALLVGLVSLQLMRDVPQPNVMVTMPQSSVLGAATLPAWPEGGVAGVSVTGLGSLGVSGPQTPRPIASVAKMMTAYLILKEKPLQLGQSGPLVTITQADADRFWVMVAQDQSVQPINPGQRLSQLQLLQGVMVPSANNYAEILAAWDAGSVAAFVEKMNREAQALGMTNTRYADVSGFSAQTVSTAADQLLLARAAMQDPVFAATVAMSQVTLPNSGIVSNVNALLGVDGIVGIKTGFTDEAGGNLAFAARREVAGYEIEVIGIVMGQEDRPTAFRATRAILTSLSNGLQVTRVVPAGQPIGSVTTAWGEHVELVVDEDVLMLNWPGMTLESVIELEDISPSKSRGDQVGWLNVRVGEQERRVALRIADDLDGAGLMWRLLRF
jgi:serine-type D-Ala-D-Ala carboxypeptidase (penicillin-binding protein 5/6)